MKPAEKRRALIAHLRVRLAMGNSEIKIQQDMEITGEEYLKLLEELYREDATQRFNKPVEQVYTDFCLRQEACIEDLNSLIQRYGKQRNESAVVGAVRAKSEILDKMIQRGQDFGILIRVPEQHQIIAGLAVKDATDSELRGKVVEQLETIKALMSRFGETDILEAIPLAPRYLPAPKKKVNPVTGEVEEGRPLFAKGGMSKAKGASAHVKIKRVKQKAPPPKS